jgi:hypothetical protein
MLGCCWWKECRENVRKLAERLELDSADMTERGCWVGFRSARDISKAAMAARSLEVVCGIAVLDKKIHSINHPGSTYFCDVALVTPIVIQSWTQILSINTMRVPEARWYGFPCEMTLVPWGAMGTQLKS